MSAARSAASRLVPWLFYPRTSDRSMTRAGLSTGSATTLPLAPTSALLRKARLWASWDCKQISRESRPLWHLARASRCAPVKAIVHVQLRCRQGGPISKEVRRMLVMMSIAKTIAACLVVLSLTLSLVLPAIAAERPTTEGECQAADMRWVQKAGKCKNRVAKQKLSIAEKTIGLIGLACTVMGLAFLIGSREPRSQRNKRRK